MPCSAPLEYRSSLVVGLAVAAAAACSSDRYDLHETKDGSLYRFDRKNGDVMALQEGSLVPVQQVVSDPALSAAKLWPKLTIPMTGDSALTVTLSTSWREGRVYYQFEVRPARILQRILERSTSLFKSFTAKLQDADGFELLQIELPTSGLIRIVDQKDQPAAYSGKGSARCSRDLYQSIATWSINWRL
jgi:hypothetical protein